VKLSQGRALGLAARLLLFFVLVVVLQWRQQAFVHELGGYPDEPAHYVTGLMVHDYVTAGMPGSPVVYARNYYLHYPKLGIGHWPPLFYLLQAAWMLPFGISSTSVLLMMAFLSALLALLLSEVVARQTNTLTGIAAAAVFLTLPIVAEFSSEVMTEIPLALVVFLATLVYAEYLDRPRWQPAALFGVLAGLALLSKGTGIELAFVPPLAILFSRRWGLLLRFSFYLPGFITVAIAAPWYLWVPGARHEGVIAYGGVFLISTRFVTTLTAWATMMGVIPGILAIGGMAIAGWTVITRKASGIWPTGFALLVSAYLLRPMIAAWEERHLVTTIPTLILFAAIAWWWLVNRLPAAGAPAGVRTAAGAIVLAAVAVFNIHAIPIKPDWGYRRVAIDLEANPAYRNAVILVSGSGTAEGALIAEVAMREPRPSQYVLRASKILATGDWFGNEFHPFYHTSAELLDCLETLGVGIVVLGSDGDKFPQGQLLREAVGHSGNWEELAHYPDIAVYGRRGLENRPPGIIRLPVPIGGFGFIGN
jgi:hypothetical protein